MGTISAARQTVGAVVRNPILIVVALVLGAIQLPQLLTQFADSLAIVAISGLLSLLYVVLYPFFFGGIIGMGNEAVEGQTSLGTFVSAGKTNYVSLFGAYLVLLGVFVLYFIGLVVVGGIGGIAISSIGNNALGGAAFVGFALVSILLYFLVLFFIQFFGQAIVLDDVGAVAGFKRSIGAVRRHKLSTLGYTVVVTLIGGIFGVFGAVLALFQAPAAGSGLGTPPLAVVVAAVAVSVVLTGVVGAFSMTYGVAFYREIRPPVESHGSP